MTESLSRTALRALKSRLSRSPETLVPPAFSELWTPRRFTVFYGGRSSAKSWSIARVLLVRAAERRLRVLCCREIQGSIKESAFRLLADQIRSLGLEDAFDIGADKITGKNGSEFFFEGLRYNASKIRSYEGVDIVWVEEAQTVSERSWEELIPTIRKAGSHFYISFNPMTPEDPVYVRFVASNRRDVFAKKVGFADNPFFSPEMEAERAWCEATDPDGYAHIWLGEPRTVSDALILKGKFFAEAFEPDPAWAGPFHGLDYGFASDPTAAVRCYIDDATRTLYVSREFWQLHLELDAMPAALEAAIPGISRHVVYADSARPESSSYLSRNGLPSVRSVEKWPGSVDDGIAYLRSFTRIVIDPCATHLLDECRRYSFKTDRLTGAPLPEPQDKHNHLIDALRYAMSPVIRNQSTGGYFNRSALLENGEAVAATPNPMLIFATAAVTDRPGSAVGAVIWSYAPYHGNHLTLMDWDVSEVSEACSDEWLDALFVRMAEIYQELRPHGGYPVRLRIEKGDLYNALASPVADSIMRVREHFENVSFDVMADDPDTLLAPTLEQRASALRTLVNGGAYVKIAPDAYSNQVTHRSSTTNHLIAQLAGFRPGADQPQELVAAFLHGCAIVHDPSKHGGAQ